MINILILDSQIAQLYIDLISIYYKPIAAATIPLVGDVFQQCLSLDSSLSLLLDCNVPLSPQDGRKASILLIYCKLSCKMRGNPYCCCYYQLLLVCYYLKEFYPFWYAQRPPKEKILTALTVIFQSFSFQRTSSLTRIWLWNPRLMAFLSLGPTIYIVNSMLF